MRGTGIFADLLAQRFSIAYQRLGFQAPLPLDVNQFRAPRLNKAQLELFDG
jgi:hypothetical protein